MAEEKKGGGQTQIDHVGKLTKTLRDIFSWEIIQYEGSLKGMLAYQHLLFLPFASYPYMKACSHNIEKQQAN